MTANRRLAAIVAAEVAGNNLNPDAGSLLKPAS